MRVVHLSTHDASGGAARAASRIHEGLRRIGVDSHMEVAVRTGTGQAIRQTPLDRGFVPRLRRAALRRRMARDWSPYDPPEGFERFSDDRAELGLNLLERIPSADLYHLHWTADYLDHLSFFPALATGTPIVWTLHDMNPFTGGCHYDAGCGRFQDQCGACPQLGSDHPEDLSRQIWKRKLASLASIDSNSMHIVGDSEWTSAEASRSSLLGRFRNSTIHYGLDTEVFRPSDPDQTRSRLGIPRSSQVVLFASDSLTNVRKGFSLLIEALDSLAGDIPDLHLVSIGEGKLPGQLRVPTLQVGRVESDPELAAIYSAADLFVMPSIQEAFGQTALEAAACGTPSVGFAVGGVPDVIRHGQTGMVAREIDSVALAECVGEMLTDKARLRSMGRRCREVVESEHTLERQAEKYLEVYTTMIGEGGEGAMGRSGEGVRVG